MQSEHSQNQGSLISYFVRRVQEAQNKAVLDVASGVAKDFADYKRRCGEIEGMQRALTILTETIKDIDGA